MGRANRTRKFAQVKRLLSRRSTQHQHPKPTTSSRSSARTSANVPTTSSTAPPPSSLFFQANPSLGPPYQILLDTNFFTHSIRAKLDIQRGLMDLLLANCTPVVTECCLAELEKLGERYRLALRAARDERWVRLKCAHKGNYADDCLVETVRAHRCYLVGTNDKGLRARLRRIPGVPLVAVGRGKFVVERLGEGV